jgi:DMSO/TMAO reductase YedYZ molybdopterin-dependent catalytic subunit
MSRKSATVELEVDQAARHVSRPEAPAWAGPASGVAATAAGLGIGELFAAFSRTIAPLDAVSAEFIDRSPQALTKWAIETFGTSDKTVLRTGVLLTMFVLSLAVGRLARRHLLLAASVIGVVTLAAAVVAGGRPDGSVLSTVVAGGAATATLSVLVRLIRQHDPAPRPRASRAPLGWDRRRFVLTTGGATALGALGVASARRVQLSADAETRQQALGNLPAVADPAAEVPLTATLSPITPFITPNDDFYRIDTAPSFPRINLQRWRLEINGMVDAPLTFSYDDLLAMPHIERPITIACVSNEVGGDLIGTALWQGVPLADLVRKAKPRAGAQQVFSTSIDGWTCGFPVDAALDGRDAMVAIGMNGEPLPLKNGFPARLIVPGLYGYVSATKWLRRIELTTWAERVGYWVPLGWSREAPIKTQSRIDVPRRGDRLVAGPVIVAGVAWAQRRGVASVEVRVDDGPWEQAVIADDVSDDTWRQWRYEWQATPGEHRLQVRATDKSGETQTEDVARPDPDGATGWHTRTVTVG